MKSIVLVGYYGAGNFGDELMLEGVLHALPSGIEVSILSFGGTAIECSVPPGMHIEKRTIRGGGLKSKINALSDLVQVVRRADVILFGGGTIFFDKVDRGYKNLFGPLKVAFAAQFFRRRLVIYGCGIEELSSWVSRSIARYIFYTCFSIYLRDHKSIDWACQIGGRLQQRKIKSVFDPAWLVSFVPHETMLPSNKKPTVVFCLMETSFRKTGVFVESNFLDILSESIVTFIDAGYAILLLPMQESGLRDDNRTHQLFYDRLPGQQKKNVLLVKDVTYEQKKKFLWLSDKIISMRYHPLVVGHLAGKDCLALSISGKSKQFAMHMFGPASLVNLTRKDWEKDLKKKMLQFTTTSLNLRPVEAGEHLIARKQFSGMLATLL